MRHIISRLIDAVKSCLAVEEQAQSQPGLHCLPSLGLSNMLKPALDSLAPKGVADHDNCNGIPFR